MGIIAGPVEAAKGYARRGWKVVILHGHTDGVCTCKKKNDCPSPGKHPRETAWQRRATSDEQKIEQAFAKWPKSNIGIRLGPDSGIVDIEYDSDEGKRTAQELLGDTQTPTFASSRGIHRLYAFPTKFARPEAVKTIRGVEMRFGTGDKGAQSVFPPSIHSSGVAYAWLAGFSADDVPLAPFPQSLVDLIQAPPKSNSQTLFTMRGDSDTLETHPGAGQGNRNDELCRLIGKHIKMHDGVTSDLVPQALAWGTRCSPPYPDDEVLKRVSCIVNKEQSQPPQPGRGSTMSVEEVLAELVVRRGDSIAPEKVDWLWPGRIPLGKLSLVIGQGEAGKTFVACDIIARLSCGLAFPDIDDAGTRGASLIATAEDGLADTIRPRLDDLGADHTQWYSLDLVKIGGKELPLMLDRHVEILDNFLVQHPQVKHVVLDPLAAYLGKVNSHNDAEVRGVLSPLCKLAEHRRCCVNGIMHLTKSQELKVHQRVSGSIAFINAARCAWLVCKDPDDRTEERRFLIRVKGNLKGVAKTGLAFSIEDGRIVWERDPLFISAGDLDDSKPDKPKRVEAEAFLSQFLADREQLASDVTMAAERLDISSRTLKRAKAELGVFSYQKKIPGPWFWRLPGSLETDTQEMIF